MPKTKSIAELERELASQQKRVDKLEARRAKLAASLEAVDREIAALTGRSGFGPARVKRAGAGAGRRSLTSCLSAVLAKADGAMRAMDLADAVVKAGYVTRDKNFKNTVAKTLAKEKQFRRVGRGMYKLAGGRK